MDINIILGTLIEDQERAKRNIKLYYQEIEKIEDEERRERLLKALSELELEEQKMTSLIAAYEELAMDRGIFVTSEGEES